MELEIKNVFIVIADKDSFMVKYKRRKRTHIINHNEIFKKLALTDINKEEPCVEIVNLSIRKKINEFIKSKKVDFLFYLVENLDIIDNNFTKLFYNDSYSVQFHLIKPADLDVEENQIFTSIQNSI